MAGIVHIKHNLTLKNARVGVKGHGTHIYLEFFRYDLGNIIDEAYPIGTSHL